MINIYVVVSKIDFFVQSKLDHLIVLDKHFKDSSAG